MENDYYKELNEIKKSNKESQNKSNDIIKNLISKTSEIFEQIKSKQSKDINSIFPEIIKQIKNNNNSQIEDFFTDIISQKKVDMSKYNSLVDIAENEFNENKLLLQYYIDVYNMIKEILNNGNNTNEETKVNELVKNVYQIINKYKEKNKNEKNKLYPFLYNAFQKVMNLFFNDENTNNIIDNSIYGQVIYNNNISMNMTYNNNLNNTVMINNKNKNDNIFNLNNNNILNKSFSAQRANQINNNTSSSFSPLEKKLPKNLLNKTILKSVPFNQDNINEINEESKEDNINNDTSIPELPEEILNKFSIDQKQKYNLIINFLIEESKNIEEELNLYNTKKASKNKLDILRESGEFSQYNNILNKISLEENNKMNNYFREINTKAKIYDIIKKNCEENFNFIQKYSDRNNIIINKLNQLINHIENYNIKYSSKNNNYNNMSVFANKNFDNMLNNTFNLDKSYMNNNTNFYLNKSYMNNNLNETNYINNSQQRPNYYNYLNISYI